MVIRMKLLFVSLGCDKNLVDSEVMLGLVREKGYQITNEETQADIIIVNTCCFIHDAKEESIVTILEMAQLKQTAHLKALIVTGCLAQRYQTEIKKEIPEVDAVLGTSSYDDIVQAIQTALEGHGIEEFKELSYLPNVSAKRINTTGGYYSYLKIAEGCNKRCTYCIIPDIRGSYRSVPMEQLLEEANYLALHGTKELILVAQETTMYGVDLYGEKSLPKLLRELCKIEQLHWIRILYCYPEEITEELIQVIKEEKKLCHYLDMPIQHCSDRILKLMGRKTNKEELITIIAKLRENIPDIALRTTLITGFPTESEEEHQELMDFIAEQKFERLGVFTYSPEEGTKAAIMQGQISKEVKKQRQTQLMELQQQIAFEKGKQMTGRVLEVIVEGKLPEDDIFMGRTYMDAPNVDGYLFVPISYEAMSGEFIHVRVTDSKEYDLIGEMLDESAE